MIRRALTSPLITADPRPVIEIRDDVVDLAGRWYVNARPEATLGGRLADLIAEACGARAAAKTGEGQEELRGHACSPGAGCQRLGEVDLAWIAGDLAVRSAEEADEAWLLAAASWSLAHAALRAGHLEDARAIADAAAARLAPGDDPRLRAVRGGQRLVAAMATARGGDRADADALLDEAACDAALVDQPNHYGMAFTAANVDVHRSSVALEFGDPVTALDANRRVDLALLPTVEQRTRHRLHAAHAHAIARRDADATRALLAAEQISPEVMRAHLPLCRS